MMDKEHENKPIKSKRPRFKLEIGEPTIADPAAYVRNLATENAMQIKLGSISYSFEIWFDKHLRLRQQHGDENGHRLGIEDREILQLL